MKLAIVDSWFHWPPVGGAIRSVKEIADRLARAGDDVTVLAPPYGVRGGEDFRFKIEPLKLRKLTGPILYSAVRERLKAISPDAVFVTNGNLLKPYMIAAAKGFPTLVRLYAYEMRCPASYGILFRDGHVCTYSFLKEPLRCMTCSEDIKRVRQNTGLVDRPEFFASLKFLYPFYHLLVKRSAGSVAMAIATSNYMKGQYRGVIPLERIRVLPDGVDSDFFSPGERPRHEMKIISLPGRAFDPIKGLDVLLRASSALWGKRQDFRVVVTGSGRPEILKYPFMASDKRLEDRDIPGMYRSSDIVAVPSVWGEPFGLTALESMSCETPVVASRVGGLREIIRDGETGLLFEPGNHTELASKLDALLDDEESRRRMGKAGRKYVTENYSWDGIIDSYQSLFRELMESHRAGSNRAPLLAVRTGRDAHADAGTEGSAHHAAGQE